MEFAAKEKLVVRQIHHPKQSRRKKEKKTFLLGSALNEQAAGLASFVFARTTRHYSPPNPLLPSHPRFGKRIFWRRIVSCG